MLTCPFCKEDGFDMYGLKLHLTVAGWCDVFAEVNEQTDSRPTPRPPDGLQPGQMFNPYDLNEVAQIDKLIKRRW